MNSFFKVFFASLLAMVVFCVIAFFLLVGTISGLTSADDVRTGSRAVLVIDLSENFPEVATPNPLARLGESESYDLPSFSDVIRLIEKAKGDSAVKGIYLNCRGSANGIGNNNELRNALLDFKSASKFIYAYGDVISQNAYHVASVADKVYCNPHGGLDWSGFVMQMAYVKGTLEKLEIEPQIFYAGKFKSATEPFRETKMTEPNRVQTTELINDLYTEFLEQVSVSRKIDTGTLRRLAVENAIRFPGDALRYKLVDGLKYDDEIRNEIRSSLKIGADDKINFISIAKYAQAVSIRKSGTDKIAIIYAAGNIVDGAGDRSEIGGDTYRNLIRKVRTDKSIKALVLRINSGGGSALASEIIWRELELTRKAKPVIVSFGDVAASGGYYIAAPADSIFAQPNTITGSIGVFSLIPNMEKFFNNKLGMTFDAVKTAPDADAGSIIQPLTPNQRRYFQESVDSIYHVFKSRVADGRNLNMTKVDSIGQGRVWSGERALQLGLVDRIGGLQNALGAAAKMANLTSYGLREYPEPQNIFDYFMGSKEETMKSESIEKELGPMGNKTYRALKSMKSMIGITQARLPFEFDIN